jgi:hypothetical protein
MANGDVVIGGVKMSLEVARRLEMAGIHAVGVADDIARLRDGRITREELLEEGLVGLEGDDASVGADEWREYVSAVYAAACARYHVQVRGDFAGSTGGWRAGVAGTLNQTGLGDDEASTFATHAAAEDALAMVREAGADEARIVELV